jgi:predicted lipoprotein
MAHVDDLQRKRIRNPRLILGVISIFVGVGVLAVMWNYGFTVVSIAQVKQVEQSEAFDPVKYVDGLWADKIIPTITARAVDLPTILNAIHPKPDGYAAKDELVPIAKQYGLITVGEAQVYSVKLKGKVLSVDAKSRSGAMEIQLDGYTGPIKVYVYVGTSIPSDNSSIRDAVGFINFGDFKEQTQYGKVAAEINSRVVKEVLDPLDKGSLQGKTVSVTGAFTIRTFNLVNIDVRKITIVPIRIESIG